MYRRIFKTLHILSYIDSDETYRPDIKGIRNLQKGRHALARKSRHGKKGELYHRYERGLENQLGSLGLVLNCVVLWTTIYLDAASSGTADRRSSAAGLASVMRPDFRATQHTGWPWSPTASCAGETAPNSRTAADGFVDHVMAQPGWPGTEGAASASRS